MILSIMVFLPIFCRLDISARRIILGSAVVAIEINATIFLIFLRKLQYQGSWLPYLTWLLLRWASTLTLFATAPVDSIAYEITVSLLLLCADE